ncbi:MAG: hypothetical protein ACTMUB_02115 [cyanobacterium endosymbiont of Rhopalodia musculus]|uniref:hypothetical protein n=1 Tax=cyanobacterium endosymbiont of Epithemia clementina EcSB TaxID=3034674 RepID=UPI0024819752|nr:hypothetical protein [cyanobacterium endosymbiont of Epithemia clementina EcSB]WGT67027.1 hypothetical protein P3F56_07280 [cyanobacterium endosymbiont of Epithemia clementina EcSB]
MENENKRELKKFNALENKKFQAKSMRVADGINSEVFQVVYENKKMSQWAKPQYYD